MHRRQVWVQILLPMIAGVALIVVLAVLVTVASTFQVMHLADISLILMIVPTAVTGLIFLVIFSASIYLLARLLIVLPAYARLVQIYLDRITEILKKAADRAADPVLAVEGVFEGIRVLFRRPSNHQKYPKE